MVKILVALFIANICFAKKIPRSISENRYYAALKAKKFETKSAIELLIKNTVEPGIHVASYSLLTNIYEDQSKYHRAYVVYEDLFKRVFVGFYGKTLYKNFSEINSKTKYDHFLKYVEIKKKRSLKKIVLGFLKFLVRKDISDTRKEKITASFQLIYKLGMFLREVYGEKEAEIYLKYHEVKSENSKMALAMYEENISKFKRSNHKDDEFN